MILNLVIENFRSIKNKTCISFEPGKLKEFEDNYVHIDGTGNILISTVIYGANASGKSNILIAFKALEYLVENSSEFKPDKPIAPYEPFKLDETTQKKPVFFEIDFIASDHLRYIYSITFSQYKIEKERLTFFPKGHKSLLFSRTGKQVKYGDYYKGERKSVEKKLLKNQLFLSKAVLDNVEILNSAYSFFGQKLMVFPFLRDYHESHFHRLYAERLADPTDKNFAKRFNNLICALDTGIYKVEAEETDWDNHPIPESVPEEVKNKIKEEYKYQIRTLHKVFRNHKEVDFIYFDKENESNGTQSLFVLGGLILDVLEGGAVLVVDEFEKNLHPHLTRFLIKMFHNPTINKHNAQLIFATHDISQLDNDIFRRDQIWFTEKDEYGETTLFSLAEIKGLRNTVPYDKWYDSGRLGATPIINELEMLFEDEAEH